MVPTQTTVRDVAGLPPAPSNLNARRNGHASSRDVSPGRPTHGVGDREVSTSTASLSASQTALDVPEDLAVRVAVRSRPLVTSERLERARECLTYPQKNQVCLGESRVFKFDETFDPSSTQLEVYERLVSPLVTSTFNGYNATVLAYGQTGSGKTYTMGSGSSEVLDDETGIIPRVIADIFKGIEHRKNESKITVRCVFLEVHNEEVRDLLHPDTDSKKIQIRENADGAIVISGIREEKVMNYQNLIRLLDLGCVSRTTGGTNMNTASSRSHAIFTVIIEQTHVTPESIKKHKGTYSCSKFHLVDLAGSERNKRTKATGVRFQESININSGLLALGNVISALSGDDVGRTGVGKSSKKNEKKHVPYRDSKLTRLLQDSLGGNSRTCVVACVSPVDTNFEETLNTLKYAQRARNIKNKPKVNRDPKDAQLAAYNEGRTTNGLKESGDGTQNLFADLTNAHRDSSGVCKFCAGGIQPGISSAVSPDKSDSSATISQLTRQLSELTSELTSAKDDLRRDEKIFTEKMREIKALKKAAKERQKEQSAGNTTSPGGLPPVPFESPSVIGNSPVDNSPSLIRNTPMGTQSEVGVSFDENDAPFATPRGSFVSIRNDIVTPSSQLDNDLQTKYVGYTASEISKIENERIVLKQQAATRARAYQLEKKNLERRLRELSRNIESKEALIVELTKNEQESQAVTQQYEHRLSSLESEKAGKEAEAARLRAELRNFTKMNTSKDGTENDSRNDNSRTAELELEVRKMRAMQESLRRGLREREVQQSTADEKWNDQLGRYRKITEKQNKRIDVLTANEQKVKEALIKKNAELALAKQKIQELAVAAYRDGAVVLGEAGEESREELLSTDDFISVTPSPRVSRMQLVGGSMSNRDRALLYGDKVRSSRMNGVLGARVSAAGASTASLSSQNDRAISQDSTVDLGAIQKLVDFETKTLLRKRLAKEERDVLSLKHNKVLSERDELLNLRNALAVKRELTPHKWTAYDERELRDLDDRADGLDAELEFTLGKIKQLPKDNDSNDSNDSNDMNVSGAVFASMRAEEARVAAVAAMAKAVQISVSEKKLVTKTLSLEAQLADAQRAIEEMESHSRMREMEYDRRVTEIRREHGRREGALMKLTRMSGGSNAMIDDESNFSSNVAWTFVDGDDDDVFGNDAIGTPEDLGTPHLPARPTLPATPQGRGTLAYPGSGATAAGRRDAGEIRIQ